MIIDAWVFSCYGSVISVFKLMSNATCVFTKVFLQRQAKKGSSPNY